MLWAPWMVGGMVSLGAAVPGTLPCPDPVLTDSYVILAALQEQSARARQLVARARRLVGIRSLRSVTSKGTDDCSGLVRYLYEREGVDLIQVPGEAGGSAVAFIYQTAKKLQALRSTHPAPGDLVFFRDTYDRNRDGRRNDGLTHVGLVESVDDVSGTLRFIHRSSMGVTRERMNLRQPLDHQDPASREILNDYVRPPGARASVPRLAGELFAGFASAQVLLGATASTPSLARSR